MSTEVAAGRCENQSVPICATPLIHILVEFAAVKLDSCLFLNGHVRPKTVLLLRDCKALVTSCNMNIEPSAFEFGEEWRLLSRVDPF